LRSSTCVPHGLVVPCFPPLSRPRGPHDDSERSIRTAALPDDGGGGDDCAWSPRAGGLLRGPGGLGRGNRARSDAMRSSRLSDRGRIPSDLHHRDQRSRQRRGSDFLDGHRDSMPGGSRRHATCWVHHHGHNFESAGDVGRPVQRNRRWRRQQCDVQCLGGRYRPDRSTDAGRHRRSVHRFRYGRRHPANPVVYPGEYDERHGYPVQRLGERRRCQYPSAVRCHRRDDRGADHDQSVQRLLQWRRQHGDLRNHVRQ
jgi:hypothetical protein